MTVVEDDDMVEELAPDAADPTFGDTVLPRAPWRGAGRLRAERSHHRNDLVGERAVAVEHEVTRSGVERERLAQLLCNPRRLGVIGHLEVNDPSSTVLDREPDVEEPERDRWDDEEVHGGDGVAVVAKEGHPALDGLRLGRAPWHEARHRALGNLDAKHPQFSVDAWCTQVGFSVASLRTSARSSAAARGRPRRPPRESQFQ